MIMTGCQTIPTQTLETKDYNLICEKGLLSSISYSRKDTIETRREIVIHNAKVDCYCNNVCPKEE